MVCSGAACGGVHASTSTLVDPQWLELYARLICTGPPDSKMACVRAAVVPEPHVQAKMVALFDHVMFDLDGRMAGLEGVFWKLILMRDTETLGDLATAVQTLNISKDFIDTVVDQVKDGTITM